MVHAMKYIKRIPARLYATLLDEDIPRGFRSHVLLMRVMGLWPTAKKNSPQYKCLTVVFFIFAGILFPSLLYAKLFYVNSIDLGMEVCYISLICCANALKAVVVFRRRNNVRDLFRIHAVLVRDGRRNTKILDKIARKNVKIHLIVTVFYVLSWFNNILQFTVIKSDGSSFFTLHLPIDKRRGMYMTVVVYEMVGALANIFWLTVLDTFPVALINTASGHVTQLKVRLRQLGSEGDDLLFYKGVVDCCRRYEVCLR